MNPQMRVPPATEYDRVFQEERRREYPVIDAFEIRTTYALSRAKLEAAARVLACPVKQHPPNWQHGRVIYAATRRYLAGHVGPCVALDVGTAKGFSALCLLWAGRDAAVSMQVTSVDVIDPLARQPRNTVADCDGVKTLAEVLAPWPEAAGITFHQQTGLAALQSGLSRIHVAFIDGKHDVEVVTQEGRTLAARQQPGDLAIFDDLQLIGAAVDRLERNGVYTLERLVVGPGRAYAVGIRRG